MINTLILLGQLVVWSTSGLAWENIRFSALFSAGDVSRWGLFARINVPSREERGETDVFAGYELFT